MMRGAQESLVAFSPRRMQPPITRKLADAMRRAQATVAAAAFRQPIIQYSRHHHDAAMFRLGFVTTRDRDPFLPSVRANTRVDARVGMKVEL